jgi:hypothetical protein
VGALLLERIRSLFVIFETSPPPPGGFLASPSFLDPAILHCAQLFPPQKYEIVCCFQERKDLYCSIISRGIQELHSLVTRSEI